MEDNIKEDYKVIGEFVSKVNIIEFLINSCIEMLITHSIKNEDYQNDIFYFIDSIHKLSLRDRISFIITILSSKDDSDAIKSSLIFF